MAKKKKEVSTSYDTYLQTFKLKKSSQSEEDCLTVNEIMDIVKTSTDSRQNNNYHGATVSGSNSVGSKDWKPWWETQEKQYSMWAAPQTDGEYRSNVKSPIVLGRVEAVMQKMRKWQIRWAVKPADDDDKDKAKLAEFILDLTFQDPEMRRAIATWFKDALIHGTSFLRLTWREIRRDYKYPKTANLSKEEEKQVKEGKVIWEEKKDVVKFKGLVAEPVSIYEIFPDPQAKSNHGRYNACRYIDRKTVISFDDFRFDYAKDPNCKNTEFVKSGKDVTRTADYSMFLPPEDINGESVLIIEHEDQMNDRYVIIANGVVIRDTPLPYNHKEITYIKLDCIEFIHQYYGMGIPDLLKQIQATDEIGMNMILDALLRNVARKTVIAADGFGEFTRQMIEEDNQYISLKTNNQPIGNMIYESQHIPLGNEIFRILEINKQNATIATQMDPAQLALQQAGRTATATATSSAIIESAINSIMRNFMDGGLAVLGRHAYNIITQMWSIPEVKKLKGETEEKQYNKIRLQGVKILATEGKLEVEETGDDKYSFFEVKPEYLQTKQDLDIRVSPESAQIMDSAFIAQRAREMYAQMMPNAVDPSSPERMAAHPSPLYDARKLAQMYVEDNGLDDDLLINKEKNEKQEIKEAEMDVKLLMEGNVVASVPGRSDLHLLYELRALETLTARRKELEKTASEAQVIQDPVTMEPILNDAQKKMMGEFKKIQDAEHAIAEHLSGDSVKPEMEVAMAVKDSQPAQPAMQQQSAVPMPAGGNSMDGQVEAPMQASAPMMSENNGNQYGQ